MLSEAMTQRLNEQINLEIYSAHLYLQMSSWCAHKALEGCATFLSRMPTKRWLTCDAC